MSLGRSFLKIFVIDFSGTMKARKLKVCINMVNELMYCVYQNRVQGSIFVCVEVLRPSQPNGVISSVVSLPNHTFTGQA